MDKTYQVSAHVKFVNLLLANHIAKARVWEGTAKGYGCREATN